ncbi:hypothetical protein JCM14469_32700 [Desulfatiferula olefinivorans]
MPRSAAAVVYSFDLADYQHSGTFSLPVIPAQEASAVTYNWSTDTLFVLGDEGDALVEVSKTGTQLSVMALTGFDDTEGLTYVGNNRFVLVEERLRDAYLLNYSANGSVARSGLQSVDLGTSVGNIGLEGISYDPESGQFITVKEKTPQDVNVNTIDFDNGTAQVSSLFTPNWGVSDLGDVQVLGTVASLLGTADGEGLLLLSQESSMLLEVDRMGNIQSQFDLSGLTGSAEGVTIDADGIIYIVAENGSTPTLYTLSPTPVPLPGSLALFGSALAGMAVVRRRKV